MSIYTVVNDAYFSIKQGDTGPMLAVMLAGPGDVMADLTGATVTFSMTTMSDAVVIDKAPVNVIAPEIGYVRYEWKDEDTAVAGVFLAEFEVIYQNGMKQTFPNTTNIVVTITPQRR